MCQKIDSRSLMLIINYIDCNGAALPSGLDAVFLQLNDDEGIKVFREHGEQHVKHMYYWTNIIHHMFGGPKAWGMGYFVYDGRKYYYYHMNIVDVMDDVVYRNEQKREKKGADNVVFNKAIRLIHRTSNRIYNACGLTISDRHTGNWGIYKGRVVPIDLGCMWI